MFSYVFTLRGNKAWKQAPATSGPVKVSPLALAAYEMLAAKVTLSAYDLTTQLGHGVSEPAVLRALSELWGQLRVIPVSTGRPGSRRRDALGTEHGALYQADQKRRQRRPAFGAERAHLALTSARPLRQPRTRSNRSCRLWRRARECGDVVHALMSARQLETLVVEGKTLLHVAGETPAFAAEAQSRRSDRER